MKFYSTNNKNIKVDLKEAVTKGLASDNGLYMPEYIPVLPQQFIQSLPALSLQEIGFTVAKSLIGDDIPNDDLREIVDHATDFDAPVVQVEDNIFALELFHGPTLAFKDFGARFMSKMLGYFARQQDQEIVILVATSGDTGSAVANGFLGVEGTRVIVLYPEKKVSEIQEKQFTTLGKNITAIEVDGTFDDCQRLVKQAFLDTAIQDNPKKYVFTSANSINIARLIPQSFYYFYAYGKVAAKNQPVVVAVPSGNFGNLTGGLLAKRMGLPISLFLAATNENDIVPEYLQTRNFIPKPSRQTISNAMDVGNPSNFSRMLDLYENNYEVMKEEILGYSFSDLQTKGAMRNVATYHNYTLDPHGAIGYLAIKKYLEHTNSHALGIFLETAHPAKFKDVVEDTLNAPIQIPASLQKFLNREKKVVKMDSAYSSFKNFLLSL